MADKRAGPAFLYVLGDPYSRFVASKIGITQRLEKRLSHIYSNTRRHTNLPDGMAVFSLYSLPNWHQAAELERALLSTFRDHKTDARTLGWLALKPNIIDRAVVVMAERLGIECEQHDFHYERRNHEDDKTPSELPPKKEQVRVNFDLTTALHLKLKLYAIRQGKTVKEVLSVGIDRITEGQGA
jgi:hypothetical protein